MQYHPDPDADKGRHHQRQKNAPHRAPRASAADIGGFFQLFVHLQERRAHRTSAVGEETNGEADRYRPDRAVNRQEVDFQKTQKSDAEHDAGNRVRHEGQLIEQFPPPEFAAHDHQRNEKDSATVIVAVTTTMTTVFFKAERLHRTGPRTDSSSA